MGRVHIWIRKEDEEAWAAIKNKPEWLHEKLHDKLDGLGFLVNDQTNEATYEGLRHLSQEELTKQFDILNAEIAKEWAIANGWIAPEGQHE